MSYNLLKAKPLAEKIKLKIKERVEDLSKKGIRPHLVAIEVGKNSDSESYIRQQKKMCQDLGIIYQVKCYSEEITQKEISLYIEELNKNPKITGIILQMPLPEHIDAETLHKKISPVKDVEGTHPDNVGMLLDERARIVPPTPLACMELLNSTQVDLKGKEVVVVGHSKIVGKPLTLLLLQSQTHAPTVTVCHISTKDLKFHTKRADILFVAAGKPGLIKYGMVKEGAIVIDVGTNMVDYTDESGNKKSRLVGDTEFEKIKDICYYITPVPGGVGPLTVIMLIRNVLECISIQLEQGLEE